MNNYVTGWIKTATSQPNIVPPDKAMLNGYTNRPEVWECMESLELVHKQGGVQEAKKIWQDKLSKIVPDIAEVVDRPPLIKHISELEVIPPVKWLIDREVPEESLTVIFGAPEAGKSFLAIDYAAQISIEHPIVYIAAEGVRSYYARYHAWLKHSGRKKAGQFHVIDRAIQFLNIKDIDMLIEECETIKPVAIVIDTLSRCFVGGDENNQKDVGIFIDALEKVKRALHCAIILIHHTTKNADTERGSTVLRGAADSMIYVSNEENVIRISCSKMKDFDHFPARYCRLLPVEVMQNGEKVSSCVMELWSRVKIGVDQLSQNQLRILECLASEIFIEGVKAPDLKAYSGVQGSSFYSALNALVKRGHARKLGKGARLDPVIITTQGMDIVRKLASPDAIAA